MIISSIKLFKTLIVDGNPLIIFFLSYSNHKNNLRRYKIIHRDVAYFNVIMDKNN